MNVGVPLSAADLLVGLLVAVALTVAATLLSRGEPERGVLIGALVYKFLFCFVLCSLSTSALSGGDLTGYHELGQAYAEILRTDFFQATSEYLQANFFLLPTGASYQRCQSFSGLVHALTFDSFVASSVVFSAFGFVGQWLCYKTFTASYPEPKSRCYWRAGLLFCPSLTFWSAGLLKDPLGVFGLGLALYGASILFRFGRLGGALALAAGVYTLLLFRGQVVPVLLLALAPPLLGAPVGDRVEMGLWDSPLARLAFRTALVLAFVGAWVFVPMIDGRYNFATITSTLFEERSRYRGIAAGSTVLTAEEFDAPREQSIAGLLVHWPAAVAFTLFRPFLWEGLSSPVIAAAALENSILLGWTALTLLQLSRRLDSLGRVVLAPWFLSCCMFVALFGLAVGVSSPNLGTVSRYRLPILPFYVAGLVILGSPRWNRRP